MEREWKRVEKDVRQGGKKGKKALDLFLKKYSDHELENPLEYTAIEVFEQADQQ